MEKQYRLLVIASHPVQYAVPIFREMAKNSPIDVLVAYCCMAGVETFYDRLFWVLGVDGMIDTKNAGVMKQWTGI